ncbi:MAG TPA: phosphoribosyl-ATP diphosphatase [Acetobacteraceae bacterium]|jgi:phosphoribosyl-ATP pyrophosphohydrolase
MAKPVKTEKPAKPAKKAAEKAKKQVKAKPAAKKKTAARAALAAAPATVLPPAPPQAIGASPAVLDRLWNVVLSRRDADPAASHSARLLSRGTAKVAQKFGEEAVECLIEAIAGNRGALVAESADVLYHLLVMWVDAGIHPDEVWAELQRREGVSGIAEKMSRVMRLPIARGLTTRKIP